MYRPERPKGAKDEVKWLASIADQVQGRLLQTKSKADYSRPKHSEIRGATSISDAFIFLHISFG